MIAFVMEPQVLNRIVMQSTRVNFVIPFPTRCEAVTHLTNIFFLFYCSCSKVAATRKYRIPEKLRLLWPANKESNGGRYFRKRKTFTVP